MSNGDTWAMPLAVVIAGAAIGAGLYFGLRAQVPAVPVVPVAPVVAAPVVPPPAPARPVASAAVVLQQASEALSYQRAGLQDRCFRPALAAKPGLTMDLLFNVTFDAEGRQLGRGTVELGGSSTPELTTCINEQLVPLHVPPPGATVMVEVPLRFP